MAPPLFQNAGQETSHAALIFVKSVAKAAAALDPKWQVNSMTLVPASAVRMNW
jgi:hypothetical protein